MKIHTYIRTYIHTYIFVVNFDAQAQASDIRIERRQVVFLCCMQDSNPRSQTPIRQQTECLLTNRLSYRGSTYKTWTRQPVPMISKHSAHSTSLPVGFRTWLWRYTYLLLISMLWHRQAIFESKGDKLSSSAACRNRTQGLRHLFASRLNACWQTDWAIEDKAKKNFNSTAHAYDQQSFNHLDLTASWLSHLALAIYMFVVINFDALTRCYGNTWRL